MNDARGLRLELSPSPILATVIVALHSAAALCAVLVVPGPAGMLLAAALVALGGAATWARALLLSGRSVRAIELPGAGGPVLELANGERYSAEVGERRYVSRFMVNISVRRPFRRTLLIFRDMLATDSFRRLRIWALWGKLPRVAEKQLSS